MRVFLIALSLLMGLRLPALSQEVVYIIRHAEKAAGEDPTLTPSGRRRAAGWAEMLSQAGLDLVLTSDAARTRETGGVIADALGLPHDSLPAEDIAGLVDTLQFDHEGDVVLIVGHTETIPGILEYLGATESVELARDDYASLFVLLDAGGSAPRMIRLRMP